MGNSDPTVYVWISRLLITDICR